MKKPLVSVIVATYRRDKSLDDALKSLSNQTYDNLEVVVIDDNANNDWNDKVKKIFENNKKVNKKIIYNLIVNKKNQGSAKTRNIGIKKAKGEYVTFLDDDDIYLPNKIINQVKCMIDNNADYGITDLYLYNEHDDLIERRTRGYLKNYLSSDNLVNHLEYHMTGTDTLMFKKEYLEKIGMFDPIDVGDEFYLMLKAINGNGKLCYYPNCDVKAYVHTGDVGLSSGESKIQGENALFEYKKQFFNKIDRKSRKYIEMRHHAVLAFSFLKMKKYTKFIGEGIKSFVKSPIQCIKLFIERK